MLNEVLHLERKEQVPPAPLVTSDRQTGLRFFVSDLSYWGHAGFRYALAWGIGMIKGNR